MFLARTKVWTIAAWIPPVVFAGFLSTAMAGALGVAEPMIGLQRAFQDAERRANTQDESQARLHRDTLKALKLLAEASDDAPRQDRAAATLTVAEQREATAAIGTMQATAALRRARQALNEAVNEAVEQGESLERAAARAARGELAPSVSDLIACDGPDCTPVSAREHAALVLIGAVGPNFDPGQWPPKDTALPITVLTYTPQTLPLVVLRQAADVAARRAAAAGAEAARLREMLRADSSHASNLASYARARLDADAALTERNAAEARVQQALRRYADAGRSLKRAALLAGDGYALKSGGRKACAAAVCISADGLEAAAFIVIGAAENMNDGLTRFASYIAPSTSDAFVFR